MPAGPEPSRLTQQDLAVSADALAPALVGAFLARKLPPATILGRRFPGLVARTRVIETEAYLGPEDKAAHSAGWRRTPRTEPMFGPAGTSYVFLTYGMHHCFNIVCDQPGVPQAVLIRAVEPPADPEAERRLRAERASRSRGDPTREIPRRDLCRGPARLCDALAIDRGLNGVNLLASPDLWLEAREPGDRPRLTQTARIGVEYAEEWANRPLRWIEAGNPLVSGPAKLNRSHTDQALT